MNNKQTTKEQKCKKCLAHYFGAEHTCPPWIAKLKELHDKKEISWEDRFDKLEWPMHLAGTGVDMEMVERDKQIKSFITQLLKAQRESIIERLRGIRDWPSPSDKAGEGGPGPLFTAGLLTQYENDKDKHGKQLDQAIKEIENA